MVAVPAVFDPDVRPPFALPKLTVAAAGAVLLLALALGERVLGGPKPPWRNALAVPVAFLLLWTVVSALASPDPSTSVLGARESLNGLLTTAVLAVLFFAAAQSFDVASVRTAMSVLWFGGGGVVLAYGALQLAGRVAGTDLDPVPWLNPLGARAIWSTLGNPNDLAGFLAVLLPIGLVLLFIEPRPAFRALTASILAVLLVELASTTARGALLAAAAALAVVAASYGGEVRARGGTVAAAAALAAVVGVTVLVPEGMPQGGSTTW